MTDEFDCDVHYDRLFAVRYPLLPINYNRYPLLSTVCSALSLMTDKSIKDKETISDSFISSIFGIRPEGWKSELGFLICW